MSVGNFYKLKFKYKFMLTCIVIAGIALASLPTWYISLEIAKLLSIDPDLPVKDQDNGYIWVNAMLFIFISGMLLARARIRS